MRGMMRLPRTRLSLRRGAKVLARNRRGATIIEFAIVSMPLIALLIASLETALVFFVQEALETATEAAARTIITGQTQKADATGIAAGMTQTQLQQRFHDTACSSLPSFLSCSKLYVDVQSADTFAAINTAPPPFNYDSNHNPNSNFNYNTGTQGSVVIVRLMYLWPVPPGPLGFDLSNTLYGNRLLTATSVAKTEAYT